MNGEPQSVVVEPDPAVIAIITDGPDDEPDNDEEDADGIDGS